MLLSNFSVEYRGLSPSSETNYSHLKATSYPQMLNLKKNFLSIVINYKFHLSSVTWLLKVASVIFLAQVMVILLVTEIWQTLVMWQLQSKTKSSMSWPARLALVMSWRYVAREEKDQRVTIEKYTANYWKNENISRVRCRFGYKIKGTMCQLVNRKVKSGLKITCLVPEVLLAPVMSSIVKGSETEQTLQIILPSM